MSKDPAVLFYTSDFISATEFLSFEQKGKYIHILCIQHQNGHLPKDYMLKIIGSEDDLIWSKFLVDDQGRYYNKRMDEESQRRKKFTESRRNNISKRYEPTSEDTYGSTSVVHMKPHMETETGTEAITNNVILLKETRFNKETILQYFTDKGYPENEAELFYNHYSAQGWVTGSGLPITNWKLKAENWHKEQSRRELNAKSKQVDSRGKGAIDFNKYEQLRKLNPGT